MIKAAFPHMALNSHNVPGEEYEMWNTMKVAKSTHIVHLLDWVKKVAKGAPGGKLQTLIFNSHGRPGKISIGQGIRRKDVEKFRVLKGFVVRIWIVACSVAKIRRAGTITDGNWFCYRLAQESGAYVTASSVKQRGPRKNKTVRNWHEWEEKNDSLPYGYIDDWELPVHRWTPKGERF